MMIHIAMFTMFVTGIYTAPDHGKGCYIDTKEKNTQYSTGMSCEKVMEIIDTQYHYKGKK